MDAATFIPILCVKDARKSAQFYQELLGLTCEWEHQFGPDYPLFMSISCDSLKLFLSEHSGSGTDSADLYVFVPEVDALHAKFLSMGVMIEQSPEDQPWGVREIQIRDLDQHRLTLGTRTA